MHLIRRIVYKIMLPFDSSLDSLFVHANKTCLYTKDYATISFGKVGLNSIGKLNSFALVDFIVHTLPVSILH